MSRGEMAFAGKGDETRDWLHIEDAASLLITAADYASPACSVANGATGKGVAIRNVLEALAERLGAPQLPVFSGIVRKGDPAHYVADVADALNWGWSPQRRWPDEICAYVDWFKKEVA
jgi:UDP-glucose 4-epimerase